MRPCVEDRYNTLMSSNFKHVNSKIIDCILKTGIYSNKESVPIEKSVKPKEKDVSQCPRRADKKSSNQCD